MGQRLGSLENLAGGPAVIDLLAEAPPTPALTDMPSGGVHPPARTVSLWVVQTVAGIHHWPLPGWEGWSLDFHGEDHTHQAGLLPADFPLPQPSLAAALRKLADGLGARRPTTPRCSPVPRPRPARKAPSPW
ncbi:hypothetical protein [Streptomyces sp. NPDC005799]|uniref:hypothetical protein n=1 Tax=Streptomyces sp. NPDC005799 TaxID=3154678 RepID=UPI0033C1E511